MKHNEPQPKEALTVIKDPRQDFWDVDFDDKEKQEGVERLHQALENIGLAFGSLEKGEDLAGFDFFYNMKEMLDSLDIFMIPSRVMFRDFTDRVFEEIYTMICRAETFPERIQEKIFFSLGKTCWQNRFGQWTERVWRSVSIGDMMDLYTTVAFLRSSGSVLPEGKNENEDCFDIASLFLAYGDRLLRNDQFWEGVPETLVVDTESSYFARRFSDERLFVVGDSIQRKLNNFFGRDVARGNAVITKEELKAKLKSIVEINQFHPKAMI